MTKEELLKQLEEEKESVEKIMYKTAGRVDGPRFLGRLIELERVIDLAEKLDEPKKVVIPQFVADWIENAQLYSDDEVDPLGIIYYMGDFIGSKEPHCEWLKNIYNQKLLLNAIANGYEVEKEKKYRVKLPGLIGSNGQQYISKSMDDKLFACAYRDYLEQEFTKEELDKFPNWVQQLEFEEVDDD